jgi:hypothetical protein
MGMEKAGTATAVDGPFTDFQRLFPFMASACS